MDKEAIVRRIKAKRILTKSSSGFYTVNHYVGCVHGCEYCYAKLYARKYYRMDDWSKTVIVKGNAPKLLLKEAKRGMDVWLSSMSDAYQPVEALEKLTRRVIEVLGAKGANIDILTKSQLVLRDLDLLKRYNITVGFTIVSTKKIDMEKNAPHPRMRIEALKKLKEAGLRTYVFVGPILPETDVEEIVRKTKDYADFYYFDRLRHTKELGLKPFYPDREEVEGILMKYGVQSRILF